jgi:pyruvate dehydrogenase E2 component (dihydrolipoamide acetyltransferase)
MPIEFRLPELGENVTTGDIVRVLVKPGDVVAKDQPVVELETEKATIEVPSAVAGRVTAVPVRAGEKVRVGQVVLVVEEMGAGAPVSTGERAAAAAAAETTAPVVGRTVASGEPREATGAAAGAAFRAPRGEVVEMSSRAAVRPPAEPEGEPEVASEPPTAPPVPAAPSVRRLARELGVDIRLVRGSGPGGRIAPEDVKAYVQAVVRERTAGGVGGPRLRPLPDFSKWGPVERRPMSSVRRATAVHTSEAWAQIPHVYHHDVADVTALEAVRARYAPLAERAGGKLTITAIALKVAAAALKRFPQFNASVDMAAEEVVFKQYVHIGVAVDTDRGLLVPVVRDVDRKGLVELAVELARLSEKARARKLALDEMEGASFTITNLGGIGGTSFSPIVNHPEVAILGLARASRQPVWDGGQFVPRLLLPLALSYDHRVIDGADAARFLRFVAEAFEQPFVLAL